MFDTLRGRLRPSNLFSFTISLFIATLLLSPVVAAAGEWRVTPIRLFFDRGARSGILNVQNDSDSAMNLQVKAMAWDQDAEGKDQYADTGELVFFPKFLTIPPKEERVIRIGIKGVPGPREKTYRLFIEEVTPPRKDDKTEGATVFVNVRFAVPLFISPAKDGVSAQLQAELHGTSLVSTLQNTGNMHFRLSSLDIVGKTLKGEETFKQKIEGWYLLSGATRTFTADIPAEACLNSDLIEIEGITDRKISLKSKITVDKSSCRP